MKPAKILFFTLFLILLNIPESICQVQVDVNKPIIDMIKSLEGPGVKISNISWHSSPKALVSPIGYFKDPINYTGLGEGLLITTGSAKIAQGPNNSPSNGQNNNDITFDGDLQQFSGGLNLYDLCYVQFDIVTSSTNLSFNYVFASEEYPEYINYNDVFALMISGPGIAGNKNLALVPGTNIPVSVSNINHTTNSQYYRENFSNNIYTQYDGMTVVLTASTTVLPCETYRIKLAIADASDHIYDSGVFIKSGSFKSEEPPVVSIEYEHPDFNFAIEGCNKAFVKFKRPASSNINLELVYKIQIGGTAINGTDYLYLKDSVKIPAGEQAVYFTIDAVIDNIKEGEEFVKIDIGSTCPQFPILTSFQIPIRDNFPYSIQNENICYKETVQLNKNPQSGTMVIWENNTFLSCQHCLSPIVTSDTSEYYTYTITHINSGCTATDSVLVNEVKLIPEFTYNKKECYTSFDIQFNNQSKGGNRYFWDFGDGQSSNEFSPVHEYKSQGKGSSLYTVKLLVSSTIPAVCSEEISKTVKIDHPIFIPNLITADGNHKNDNFAISGIGGECWTLFLYNRWGALVYKKDNYTDQFEGSQIEPGNYYYHIENSPKDRTYNGWLHIVGPGN